MFTNYKNIAQIASKFKPSSDRTNFPRLMDSQCSSKITFTVACWFTITSNSCFVCSSYRAQFVHLLGLRLSSGSHHCLPLNRYLWHVTIAHSIRAMRACRCPYYRRSLHHTLIIHGLTCYLSLMALPFLDSALSSFLPYAYAYVAIL